MAATRTRKRHKGKAQGRLTREREHGEARGWQRRQDLGQVAHKVALQGRLLSVVRRRVAPAWQPQETFETRR